MAFVNALDPTLPLGSDAVSLGDDQIRLTKAALIERIDSFFTGHDVQPWQAKSGSGAATLWVVSDAVEAIMRLAYTGAGSRSLEYFANAAQGGWRDLTGAQTMVAYTYSSALLVVNTSGSLQLKVGVGQTISTWVNGVSTGQWAAGGLTVNTGLGVNHAPTVNNAIVAQSTTNDAGSNIILGFNSSGTVRFSVDGGGMLVATSVAISGAVDNTFTTSQAGGRQRIINTNAVSGTATLTLESTAALTYNWALTTNFDGLGEITLRSSNVVNGDPYGAGTSVFRLTRAGALTLASGLTVSAGGITVSAGGASITGGLTLPGLGAGTGVVSVGATDSGGVGFRLLRIPN